jgi:hypothetical protein
LKAAHQAITNASLNPRIERGQASYRPRGALDLALGRSARRNGAWRRGICRISLAGAASMFAFGIGFAAPVPTPLAHPPRNFDDYIPTTHATRIQASEAPTIDGDPSEPVWQRAEAIDEFYQVDPNPGQPGSQPTIARFLYDENNLYVAIYAYDSEPDKIIATVKARDGRLDTDDGVRIYIDPELTRRNAYYFEMNPLGARVDALIQNNNTYIDTWNTIWDGKAKIQPDELLGRDGDSIQGYFLRSQQGRLGARDPAPCPAHRRAYPLDEHPRRQLLRRRFARRHAHGYR